MVVPACIFGQLMGWLGAGGWLILDDLIVWLAFGWLLAGTMGVPGPYSFSSSGRLAWACSHGGWIDFQEKRKCK